MHFLWPQLLWLLGTIPLMVLAYLGLLRRRRRQVLRYASLAIVKQAMAPGLPWRRHMPPALLLAAIALLLLAAARPQAVPPLPTEQASVVLALDVSFSMQADDIQPSRMEAAREAAKAFVRRLPTDVRVGIVSFAGTAQVVQPPTRDREDLMAAIDRLHMQYGTAMGSGIVVALSELLPGAAIDLGDMTYGALERPRPAAQPKKAFVPVPAGSDRSTAIVLLTDGRSTVGMDPMQAAALAAQRGVRIHAVGLGTVDAGSTDYDSWGTAMQLDEPMLKAVTAATRGDYYQASSAQSLVQVYERLGSRMQVEVRATELAGPLALGAMLLLACAAGLSLWWFQRVA
ncbi:ABC transporter ATP-binding protein [Pseudorhodoferax sp. Leaf267]|nr:ABC transporter ATP-binding protein [Pseudorhodoferax sp. Leaf267]